MKTLIAIVISALGLTATAQVAPVAPAPAPYFASMSFNGKDSIAEIQTGKVTASVRLADRTQAPYTYKVGTVLPLVNSNKVEDARSFEDQAKAEAYKYVELTKITVAQVTALTPAQQEEVKKFYTQDKIDAAKGIVSVITFKYRPTK